MECKSPADRWRMTSETKRIRHKWANAGITGVISTKPETANRRGWGAQDELTTKVSLTGLTAPWMKFRARGFEFRSGQLDRIETRRRDRQPRTTFYKPPLRLPTVSANSFITSSTACSLR